MMHFQHYLNRRLQKVMPFRVFPVPNNKAKYNNAQTKQNNVEIYRENISELTHNYIKNLKKKIK